MTQRISWWRIHFGDEEVRKIAESISDEHISQGPATGEFERRLGEEIGGAYVVATTSCSTALLLAMLDAGVGPGDEVIVPNRTWIATAHAPMLLGAKVVLVDVERERPIVDVNEIERRITPRTKVIVPVHLNGQSADTEAVRRLAEAHGVRVIEDAAQAYGSRNRSGYLGLQSDVGCFSLAMSKLISTGQGGFLAMRDRERCERIKLMRSHGVRHVNNTIYTLMGFNFRFTDIQASIGLVQLQRLQVRIEKVRAIYRRYKQAMHELPFLTLLPVDEDAGAIPIYIDVLCAERDELIGYLDRHGIQARPFHPDLSTAPYIGVTERFPHSEVFAAQGLTLPCGPDQPLENVERVIDVLRRYANERRPARG